LRFAVPEVPPEFVLDTKIVVTVAEDRTFYANVSGVRSLLNALPLVTDKIRDGKLRIFALSRVLKPEEEKVKKMQDSVDGRRKNITRR
jgi:hypothetical protein